MPEGSPRPSRVVWERAPLPAIALVLALGCSGLSGEPQLAAVSNRCSSNSDCNTGRCDADLGICAATRGTIAGLVLDVLPASIDSGLVAGDTIAYLRNVSGSEAPPSIALRASSELRGQVYLSAGDNTCRPSPVRVNFLPVVRSLGIDARRYSVGTTLVTQISKKQYIDTLVFSLGGVPDGTYDVFMQDAQEIDNGGRPACQVAPQVLRQTQLAPSRDPSFVLEQPPARPLTVSVPYAAGLLNWTVDIIHPLTGEALSSELRLLEQGVTLDANGEPKFTGELRLTEVAGPDWANTGTELLRLRPPSVEAGPVIYLALEGLEVHEPGQAQLPLLSPPESRVRYRSWVWREGDAQRPVAGKVTFTAVKLSELSQFRTELRRTVSIAADGQVSVILPPGSYLAQVSPEPTDGSSQYETEVVVWPPAGGAAGVYDQTGNVVAVPSAVQVTGRVTFQGKNPPQGTLIKLLPDTFPALERRPGQWQFVARAVEALADSRGRFTIEGVDCRRCSPDTDGAKYTLAVIPPATSGLPWSVKTQLDIHGDLDLGTLDLEVPRVYATQLDIPELQGRDPSVLRLRARAYVLIDKEGHLLSDPTTKPCARVAPELMESTPCAMRAVPVAEAMAEGDGRLNLLLPQDVVPYPPG